MLLVCTVSHAQALLGLPMEGKAMDKVHDSFGLSPESVTLRAKGDAEKQKKVAQESANESHKEDFEALLKKAVQVK
jgi:hypothetical protein